MKFPEKFRMIDGPMATPRGVEYGGFAINATDKTRAMFVIASSAMVVAETYKLGKLEVEWDHVSVTLQEDKNSTPTWDEMCHIKELFWEDHHTVVQFHPKKSEYVNNCNGCLHLWRHKDGHKLPPKEMV